MELNVMELDQETVERIEQLGHITVSESALNYLSETNTQTEQLFERFVRGDYGINNYTGDTFTYDRAMYLREGECVGIYELPNGKRVQIRTRFCAVLTEIKTEEDT